MKLKYKGKLYHTRQQCMKPKQVYNYEKSIEYHQETVVNDNDES